MVVVLQKKINMKRQLEVKLLLKKQIIFGWKSTNTNNSWVVQVVQGKGGGEYFFNCFAEKYQQKQEYNQTHTRTHTNARNRTNQNFKPIFYFLVGK
jgi:hypothetical protein